MGALAKQPERLADTTRTPMDLLNQAVASGNIELAEKLMGLQERWEKNQSRKAFDNSISEAKKKLPIIVKGNQVSFGNTNYKFEDLAAISQSIDPILAEFGLWYRFRTKSEPGTVTVTCIVGHRDGHFEENSLTGPVDTSGGKNAIQAIGSTCTYLQRYTLKAALGLASSADTDAVDVGTSSGKITDEQYQQLVDLALSLGADRAKFCEYISKLWKIKIAVLTDIPSSRFDDAVTTMKSKGKKK